MENKKLDRIMLEYLEDIFNSLQYKDSNEEEWKEKCNNLIKQFEKFYYGNWYKLSPKNFFKISKCVRCLNEKINIDKNLKQINIKTDVIQYFLYKILKR